MHVATARPLFHRSARTPRGLCAVLLVLLGAIASAAYGAGDSPQNPLPFELATGSIPVSVASNYGAVWLRVNFTPNSTVSHLRLETLGSYDTTLSVFANLAEAQRDEPFAEDDDSGASYNASLAAPLGFPPPYLVRVTSRRSGTFSLRGSLTRIASGRCDWPAGCSLAAAAEGEPTARVVLGRLREVRSELLLQSSAGRQLNDLYWRLGKNLVPNLLADSSFRQQAYQEVLSLLPLAEAALALARGDEARTTLSAADVHRLEELLSAVMPHLSPPLAAELRSQWQTFALAAKVGRPLAEVLAETGLLARSPTPHTVVTRLRLEPSLDKAAGPLGLRTGEPALDARLAAAGATALRSVYAANPGRRAAGLTRTIAFEVASLAAAQQLAAELNASPSVEWAEVATTLSVLAPVGRDPFRSDLWGLDAVRAPQAWSATQGSCATPVAVVDTGLRSELADLQGRVLPGRGYDFINDDPIPEDDHGHGTHVSGTIAAALDNSTSVAGVAPGTCVFGVKVLDAGGSGSSESVAQGIVHAADQGAKVINLSLGCDCATQQVIEDALEYAAARDVVVVAAAGNDGEDTLYYPASSPLTIAVSALTPSLALADFSNHGPGLDLAAPGVDVVSLFRDGESCQGSGTSMATPHVAGVAALVRSINPLLNRDEVRALLRQTARDLGPAGYDTSFGAGLVDALSAVQAAGGAVGGGACTPSATALCLSDERFRVETSWRRRDGVEGQGHAVRLTADTGYFWFFDPSNVEMVLKVLNGCGAGGRFWVFSGGLTNVEVRTRVTDTATGQVKEYLNPQGTAFQPIQDTGAFATCGASLAAADGLATNALSPRRSLGSLLGLLATTPDTAEPAGEVRAGTCVASTTKMCLRQGRFSVETTWRRANGESGAGHAVSLTDDTGYFWFFDEGNVEMVLKVLKGCGANNRYWVFSGGLTNVEVTTRVTDTVSGQVQVYRNPRGTAFQPIQDTSAFATCP